MEKLPFQEAIEREFKEASAVIDMAYLDNTRYVDHLKRWYEVFPKDQMHVMVLEELAAETFRELLAFLDVDTGFEVKEFKKHNIGGTPRSKKLAKLSRSKTLKHVPAASDFVGRVVNMKRGQFEEMDPTTRERLARHFATLNEEFQDYTGLSVEKWV